MHCVGARSPIQTGTVWGQTQKDTAGRH